MGLIFVSGKGGVGKTSFASALAIQKAKTGQKVLLVEFGPKSQFKYIFDSSGVDSGYDKISLPPSLKTETWNYQEVLVEFIAHYLKLKVLVKKFFDSPLMKRLIKVAPSLRELVYLGKATSQYRNIGKQYDYDEIIIDSYSTGHFLALLNSPQGMMDAVQKGAMHDQCRDILKVMTDPDKVEYFVLCLPEQLPVVETLEFIETLKKEFSITVKLVFNKVKEPLVKVTSKNSFVTNYLANTKNQNVYIDKLKKVQPSVLEIPFIYENDPAQVVASVVNQLEPIQ